MLVFAVTIFIGAFLLFQVQPMIGKYILPWFGSGPGVWTTCMLFFQLVLLGGYAYAHFLSRWCAARTQVAVHLALLGLALALLPIIPSDAWKPDGAEDPRLHILLVLAVSVGLPYFALSTTGPLIQHWFNRVRPGASPYRLYALSNAASLLALLSYPFYFEAQLSRGNQATLWAWGLVVYVLACAACAAQVWKSATASARQTEGRTEASNPTAARPMMLDRALWLLLPACASVLLLATTNKVCQEVTVVPLLWVVPLALYLLSFIICFDSPRWYRRGPFAVALAVALAGICWVMYGQVSLSVPQQLGAYSTALFVCCMVCHGELFRLRPEPSGLTAYYLMIAAGGAAGGIFVTLMAPVVFTDYHELIWGLLLCPVLLLTAWMARPSPGRWGSWRWRAGTCAVASAAVFALGLSVWLQIQRTAGSTVARSRNFFGVLSLIKEDPSRAGLTCLTLRHGSTTHGLQLLDPALAGLPTAYYGETSGVGCVLRSLPPRGRRLGVIGLGVGTLAAYAGRGDYLRIYEIDPDVERLARQHFSYLSNCAAHVEVALGDARLSMEKESPQNFDLLVMDAFSSDAIPLHLLTREAFAVYQQHLKTNGVIAVHISNRYLNLEPVIANAAAHFDFRARVVQNQEIRDKWWLKPSIWIVLSRDEAFLRQPLLQVAARPIQADAERVRLWTDDFASLYPILRFQTRSVTESDPAESQAAIASDLNQRGDLAGALRHYRRAVEINPNFPEALNNLAWLLAAGPEPGLRDGPEAVRLAERACQLTEHKRTLLLGTLAAAYAAAGQFTNAIATAEKAVSQAAAAGEQILAAKNRELLELYRAGKPYHESATAAAGN